MKRVLFVSILVTAAFFIASCNSTPDHVPLIDNGGGLIYDPALNVTWYDYSYSHVYPSYLHPLNSAVLEGVDWDEAKSWAAGLNVGGVTGWRLPRIRPLNGHSYKVGNTGTVYHDGSADDGFNVSAPDSAYPRSTASEMAYLFYVELGNKAIISTNGDERTATGLNCGPFKNLLSEAYWLESEFPGKSDQAWVFNFRAGSQGGRWKTRFDRDRGYYTSAGQYAMAVHSGNITSTAADRANRTAEENERTSRDKQRRLQGIREALGFLVILLVGGLMALASHLSERRRKQLNRTK
jgi:hypothetical protein